MHSLSVQSSQNCSRKRRISSIPRLQREKKIDLAPNKKGARELLCSGPIPVWWSKKRGFDTLIPLFFAPSISSFFFVRVCESRVGRGKKRESGKRILLEARQQQRLSLELELLTHKQNQARKKRTRSGSFLSDYTCHGAKVALRTGARP